tara:strand:+ start:988 stop:1662 length:675 start_codon:yes stop_codon:yes gene_type:complete
MTIPIQLMKKKDKEWFKFVTREVRESYKLPPDCKGGVVIDCGSNIGAFPFVFSCRFDKYVCYEANPKNIKLMEKALNTYMVNLLPSYYNLKDYCSIENKACYKKGGMTMPIYDHISKRSGDSSIYLSHSHLKKNKIADVPTVSLKDIRKKYFCESCKIPIQLLKCDIEGAEYDFVFNQDISIFKFICMEIHSKDIKFHKMLDFLSCTHNIICVIDKVVVAKLKT